MIAVVLKHQMYIIEEYFYIVGKFKQDYQDFYSFFLFLKFIERHYSEEGLRRFQYRTIPYG